MKKKALSIKQMPSENNDDEQTIETVRMPKYIIKPLKFYCPLSPYIMWHHNLSYIECPISSNERDMVSCEKCKLKGTKQTKKKSDHKIQKIEKKHKEPIPNIGKTYTSK